MGKCKPPHGGGLQSGISECEKRRRAKTGPMGNPGCEKPRILFGTPFDANHRIMAGPSRGFPCVGSAAAIGRTPSGATEREKTAIPFATLFDSAAEVKELAWRQPSLPAGRCTQPHWGGPQQGIPECEKHRRIRTGPKSSFPGTRTFRVSKKTMTCK